MKGKVATNMLRPGVSLEPIQHLLGHASVKTTEVYIKARLPELVEPTSRALVKRKVDDDRG
jgi:site-specific recombinase XerD